MTPDLQEVSEETQNPEKWVREYGDALFRYAFSVLKDRERSEDAVQETFLAALGTKAGFEHRSSVKSWLFGILKHKIVDLIRTESRYVRPGDFEKDSDDPEALDQFFNANGRWCTPPTFMGASWGVARKQRVLEGVGPLLGPASGKNPPDLLPS